MSKDDRVGIFWIKKILYHWLLPSFLRRYKNTTLNSHSVEESARTRKREKRRVRESELRKCFRFSREPNKSFLFSFSQLIWLLMWLSMMVCFSFPFSTFQLLCFEIAILFLFLEFFVCVAEHLRSDNLCAIAIAILEFVCSSQCSFCGFFC